MFMVGGFSQSPYLQRRIREVFQYRIKLISVAPRGELAIVRGREDQTLKVDFYFGKTEIKVDTNVLGTTTTFTLAYAEALDYF